MQMSELNPKILDNNLDFQDGCGVAMAINNIE